MSQTHGTRTVTDTHNITCKGCGSPADAARMRLLHNTATPNTSYVMLYHTEDSQRIVYDAKSLSDALHRLARMVALCEQDGAHPRLNTTLTIDIDQDAKYTIEKVCRP